MIPQIHPDLKEKIVYGNAENEIADYAQICRNCKKLYCVELGWQILHLH